MKSHIAPNSATQPPHTIIFHVLRVRGAPGSLLSDLLFVELSILLEGLVRLALRRTVRIGARQQLLDT